MTTSPILPCYLVAQIDIKDYADYLERYARTVVAQIEASGGEVLAADPAAELLEGSWSGNWTVLIRFPDGDSARAWYGSADYEPLKRLRIDELTRSGNAVFVAGFDKSVLD